jgi:acetyltransferase-like isoleucine patch superfamily enzyme
MAYANKPILIKRGTWVATRTMIGAGVTVGENCVIGAGSTVLRDVPDNSLVAPSRSTVIAQRVLTED